MQREGENFTVIERVDAEESAGTTSTQQDSEAVPSTSDYTPTPNVPSTSQNTDQSSNSSSSVLSSSEGKQSSSGDSQSQSSSIDSVRESSELSTEIRRRRLEFYTKNSETSVGQVECAISSQTVHTEAPPHSEQPSTAEAFSGQESSGASSSENVTLDEGAPFGVSADGNIRVKIKYLDDRQRQVEAKPGETIGEFKR